MLTFRLRTLLIAVAVLAAPMAWVTNSLRWIQARHEMLSDEFGPFDRPHVNPPTASAPGGLWLFGEEGVALMWYYRRTPDEIPDCLEEAKRLFPETTILGFDAQTTETNPQ